MKEKDIAYDAVKAFFSFKINKDGIMAVSEVSELFEKIGHDLKEPQIENIFKDLNGDFGTSFGRIDFKEFYIAFLFAKIDKDNSGGISPSEVKEFCGISEIEAKSEIEDADTDGDGTVDYKEFRKDFLENFDDA